ncbi:MAG: class I SAM-dependent methyltransferase [Acidobacteriota bacterium]|nr:class I SAM-dependent methyltransferase [Acidobacteriota bacterium]
MQIHEEAPDAKAHWDGVYGRVAHDAVSWYRPHLETSLRLIQSAAGTDASIIDVGGGHSTLVDDLIHNGYRNVTVLDVSDVALGRSRQRLGQAAERVTWLEGNILTASLPQAAYDVWHDRAVFHFLRDPQQRIDYGRQAQRALRPGGHLIMATFGPQGPMKCSGLEVCRYDATSLGAIFGPRFQLVESLIEMHQTPSGGQQQFLYCHFQFA